MNILLKIKCNIAHLLLNVPDDLPLGGRRELVPALREQANEAVGEVTPSEVEPLDGMREGEALVDRHRVRHAVPRVKDDACRAARRVQREHGLDLDVERRGAKGLEHDLRHFLPIYLWWHIPLIWCMAWEGKGVACAPWDSEEPQ